MVKEHRARFSTGVVHSFDGGMDEMRALVEMGLYIGINGCSLKTDENLAVAPTPEFLNAFSMNSRP